MGLLKSGYLGVDIFFVINGFLIIPSLCRRIESEEFRYFGFLERRLARLLPLVVLASIVSLLVGFIGMLPDNYENLAESVVASNLFSENILSTITTGNYWNAVNDYKPLMHLWYVGVLFEFYLLFPLLLLACRWCAKRIKVHSQDTLLHVVAGISAVSLVLYLLPWASSTVKFYYLPYRQFEFSIGGLAGMSFIDKRVDSKLGWMWIVLLLFVVFSSFVTFNVHNIGNQIPVIGSSSGVGTGLIAQRTTLLILVVLLSAVVVSQDNASSWLMNRSFLAGIGKRSYSIFVWHQVLLAFYRCFVSAKVSVLFVIGFFVVLAVVSELSYRFVEQRKRDGLLMWVILAVLTIGVAALIYLRAGVVRDVPEMDITADNVHRHMHAEYVDRVYSYDKSFEDNGQKINVLVEGESFGRDFANCLLESDYSEFVNLSYVHDWSDVDPDRINNADVIFTFTSRRGVPQVVWDNKMESTELWGIGTKNYGECNEIVYSRRFADDYLSTNVNPHTGYVKLNEQWKQDWGDHYIDFMGMATNDSGRIRVFTPDGKFISQDCIHLTQAGARWYASMIDWGRVFSGI